MSTPNPIAPILADPDADGPRLAYAEQCEAADPARAELIRMQCRAAALRRGTPERRALEARARELISANGERWIDGPRDLLRRTWFVRGFVECLEAEPAADPAELAHLQPHHPVGTLKLLERDDFPSGDTHEAYEAGMARWAASPALARIRHLESSEGEAGPEVWRRFLHSPHLTGLEAITLGDEDANPDVARVIAEAPLTGLRELRCQGWMSASLGDAGATWLAGAPHLASLRGLWLWNCRIGDAGAAALAGSAHLTGLENLDFGGGNYSLNQIGPEGAKALAASPNFGGLTYLNLGFNPIGDAGATALLTSTGFPAITGLHWQAGEFGDAACRTLAAAYGRFEHLTVIDWSHNAIGTAGAIALANAPTVAGLESLWLYHNRVGSDGVVALAGSPYLRHLRELNLAQNPIDTAAVDALIGSEYLEGLESLRIGLCPLTDRDKDRLREHFGERVRL